MLLVQMQDADFNATNTDSYGDGVAGGASAGYTNLNNTGQFHFARVVTAPGGSITFSPAVPAGVTFRTQAAVAGTSGARTFQIVRVPYSRNVNVTGTLRPMSWNGSTGGVVAVEAGQNLTMSAGVDAAGLGFRGGGGHRGNSLPAGTPGTDTGAQPAVSLAGVLPDATAEGGRASKGEGIAGTPRLTDRRENPTLTYGYTTLDTGTQSYPFGAGFGDFGRGAPGNAGGGGNRHDSGGGGGGNGGAGGKGGGAYSTGADFGGYGGAAVTGFSGTRLFLGGGGGSGQGWHNPPTTGTIPTLSGGARGGGIVILRADVITGGATINVSGQAGFGMPTNLGGCNVPLGGGLNGLGGEGGGAGGSVQLVANSSSLAAITVNAAGGNGGNAGHLHHRHGRPRRRGRRRPGLLLRVGRGTVDQHQRWHARRDRGHRRAAHDAPGRGPARRRQRRQRGHARHGAGLALRGARPHGRQDHRHERHAGPGGRDLFDRRHQQRQRPEDLAQHGDRHRHAAHGVHGHRDRGHRLELRAGDTHLHAHRCAGGRLLVSRDHAHLHRGQQRRGQHDGHPHQHRHGGARGADRKQRRPTTRARATRTSPRSTSRCAFPWNRMPPASRTRRVGDTLTWSVFVHNPLGAATVANFQVDDALPAGVAITAAGAHTITDVNATCGVVPTKNAGYTGAGNNGLIAGAQTLPANCVLRIDIPTTVSSAGAKSNQASLSGTGLGRGALGCDRPHDPGRLAADGCRGARQQPRADAGGRHARSDHRHASSSRRPRSRSRSCPPRSPPAAPRCSRWSSPTPARRRSRRPPSRIPTPRACRTRRSRTAPARAAAR